MGRGDPPWIRRDSGRANLASCGAEGRATWFQPSDSHLQPGKTPGQSRFCLSDTHPVKGRRLTPDRPRRCAVFRSGRRQHQSVPLRYLESRRPPLPNAPVSGPALDSVLDRLAEPGVEGERRWRPPATAGPVRAEFCFLGDGNPPPEVCVVPAEHKPRRDRRSTALPCGALHEQGHRDHAAGGPARATSITRQRVGALSRSHHPACRSTGPALK